MRTSVEVIEAIAQKDKAEGGTGTDYRVARILFVNPQRISDIRRGRTHLSKSLCKVAGQYLHIEPAALVAMAAAEREPDPELRQSFLRMAANYLPAALLATAVPMVATAAITVADCILCKIADAPLRREKRKRGPSSNQPLGRYTSCAA